MLKKKLGQSYRRDRRLAYFRMGCNWKGWSRMGRAGHRHYGTGWAELGQDGYGQVRTGWVKQDGNG